MRLPQNENNDTSVWEYSFEGLENTNQYGKDRPAIGVMLFISKTVGFFLNIIDFLPMNFGKKCVMLGGKKLLKEILRENELLEKIKNDYLEEKNLENIVDEKDFEEYYFIQTLKFISERKS